MEIAFYLAGFIAVLSTLGMILSRNPVHGLLYMIVSLLSVAMIFFTVGAAFAGALEMIVYAGAILVLFVFVMMMLNLGDTVMQIEKTWLQPRTWILPSLLSVLLLSQLVAVLWRNHLPAVGHVVSAKQVGIALYGPYILAVELASLILLAALVVAFHLGQKDEVRESIAQ